ncbi:MAG TPA: FG-GAP-like repeat-containing protein [Bacteroidales bacterium]|nr:FG-GAP-like repeat-containing protein [Bacteroidales bacterium]
MKKNTTSLFLMMFFVLVAVVAVSQPEVRHLDEMPDPGNWEMFADVEGYFLMDKVSGYPINHSMITRDYIVMEGWPVSNSGSSSRGGVFGNIDEDDDLEVIYALSTKVFALNKDGSAVDGWPKNVASSAEYGSPAYGDIDGDGVEEIVVACRAPGTGNTGQVYAFHKDGTAVENFPIYCDGGPTNSPVLADLDDDGAMEIIVELRKWPDGKVIVYKGDASTMEGWPQVLDYIPASSVAVGDITGDDIPEIVAESYYKVWAFSVNGVPVEGFPYTPATGGVFSYSNPVLADIDGDGFREIVVGDHSLSGGTGAVHVIKNNGTVLSGWPRNTSSWIYAPVAVADIDGDSNLDLMVGDQVLSAVPTNYVYGWNKEGNNLPGFPIGPIDAINAQIIVADMDGDGLPELVFDDNTGNGILRGYNHDGTVMEGWPLSVVGSSFYTNAMVFDIEGDGTLNLSATSYDSGLAKTYKYLWKSSVAMNHDLAVLPVYMYNVRHTGVYGEINNPAVQVNDPGQASFVKAFLHPNPVSDFAKLFFILEKSSTVSISVFAENGLAVHHEILQKQDPGNHQIMLNTVHFAKGLYLVSLSAGEELVSLKLIKK